MSDAAGLCVQLSNIYFSLFHLFHPLSPFPPPTTLIYPSLHLYPQAARWTWRWRALRFPCRRSTASTHSPSSCSCPCSIRYIKSICICVYCFAWLLDCLIAWVCCTPCVAEFVICRVWVDSKFCCYCLLRISLSLCSNCVTLSADPYNFIYLF